MRRYSQTQPEPTSPVKHFTSVQNARAKHQAECGIGCELCKVWKDEARIAALRLHTI